MDDRIQERVFISVDSAFVVRARNTAGGLQGSVWSLKLSLLLETLLWQRITQGTLGLPRLGKTKDAPPSRPG
jgi:hypothetical protein